MSAARLAYLARSTTRPKTIRLDIRDAETVEL
jgi:hypothetical protein